MRRRVLQSPEKGENQPSATRPSFEERVVTAGCCPVQHKTPRFTASFSVYLVFVAPLYAELSPKEMCHLFMDHPVHLHIN